MTALWALTMLPAVVGALLCVAGRRADPWAVAVSVATASVTVALAVITAAQQPAVSAPFVAGTQFGLAVDGLSALIVVTVAVITLLVLVFAAGDLDGPPARFHGLMLLFASAVLVTGTATTLPALLGAWEVMGATSYALIGFWWREPRRVKAGATAFVTTRAADLGLYLAAGAALAGGGGLALADLTAASPGWRHVIAGGVLVAALGKAAQLPFSFWLSRAMEGPSPVSALLHSAAMVAMGGYLLLRVAPLLEVTGWAADVATWVGALTALALGAVALAQRDLKQLLAASTAAQLGFVVAAAGVGAVVGGAAQLVAHAATKALLFLVAGAWLSALGTKQLTGLRGAARRWPVVGVAAAVGLLGLAGLPPLALWATKDAILAVALERSLPLYIVLLAGAALSAAYAGKALVQVWRAPEPDPRPERHDAGSIGLLERIPVVLLAAAAAVLGVLALPPLGGRVRVLLGAAGESAPGLLELVASGVLALAVLGAVVGMSTRAAPPRWSMPRWAEGWLGLESVADAVVVRPVVGLARRLARFDDAVLDGAVEGVGRACGRLATRLATGDTAVLDRAVESLATAVRRAAAQAVRPQSGQLHHYYLQAVSVAAAGVLLLLVVR